MPLMASMRRRGSRTSAGFLARVFCTPSTQTIDSRSGIQPIVSVVEVQRWAWK
jgi:hypothetical protein